MKDRQQLEEYLMVRCLLRNHVIIKKKRKKKNQVKKSKAAIDFFSPSVKDVVELVSVVV